MNWGRNWGRSLRGHHRDIRTELGTFPKGTPQGYKQSLFLQEIATLRSQ
jgi:hypothetical protein